MLRSIAVVALLALHAGQAQAATYSLGGPLGELGATAVFLPGGAGPQATISAGSAGMPGASAVIFRAPNGLGVNSGHDTSPGYIDGSPIGTAESLTVTFGWAVRLLKFGLRSVDANDHFDISINGGDFVSGQRARTTISVNRNHVTSFTIRASGTPGRDGFIIGNDNFRLASIDVAAVPLPAGVGLLGAALAALGLAGALRARRPL